MTDAGAPRRFETTHWSIVRAAGGDDSKARTALSSLCETYWWPLYWFARRRGASVEDAQDLTQGFLTRLIDKQEIRNADQERGRFRTFLLTAFTHYNLNEAQRDRTEKRGGGQAALSLEFETAEGRYQLEPKDALGHYNLGVAFHALGRTDDAIRELEEAMDLKPDDYETRVSLGKIYSKKADFKHAIEHLIKATELKPTWHGSP